MDKKFNFCFKKNLTNKITIDEMFVFINNLKLEHGYILNGWHSDVARPIIIEFSNNTKLEILNNIHGYYLQVKTNDKDTFDLLWDFFKILK